MSLLVNDWFAPAVVALIGVGVGAAISYIIQTKTERKAWKKEIAENVFYSLYSNVKTIKTSLERRKFDRISFSAWSEFQNDYRYLQVQPLKFREQLDDFLKKVNDTDRDEIRLINEVFPDIVHEASRKIFNSNNEEISINIRCKEPSGRFQEAVYTPAYCLRERAYPTDLLLEVYPESEIVTFSVVLKSPPQFIGEPSTIIEKTKFDEFWKLCLELEDKNEVFKRTIQKQSELLKEARNIFNELQKRIEDIIPKVSSDN